MDINLKDFRQAHKLYQSDMAEILGINQSNVSRAELKGYLSLSYTQKQTLYERFGKEDVDSFEVKAEDISLEVSGNVNQGGNQNNGYFTTDKTALSIIQQQSDTIRNLAEKQAEMTEKLMVLLEKISEKL